MLDIHPCLGKDSMHTDLPLACPCLHASMMLTGCLASLQGLPVQNGETHVGAGDRLAEVRASSWVHCAHDDMHPAPARQRSRNFFQEEGKYETIRCTERRPGEVQEATFALKTNDPAGFNLIDVFAW
jgi:hypothetical protein